MRSEAVRSSSSRITGMGSVSMAVWWWWWWYSDSNRLTPVLYPRPLTPNATLISGAKYIQPTKFLCCDIQNPADYPESCGCENMCDIYMHNTTTSCAPSDKPTTSHRSG